MTNGNIILCGKDVKHRISSYETIHKHICVSRACCILRNLRFNYKKVELAQCNSVRATSTKCRMKRFGVHKRLWHNYLALAYRQSAKHLKNIFEEGELVADSVISKMETTAADGKNYTTTYYSLDAIIAVKTGEQVPVSLLTQKIVFQNCNIVT